MSEKTLDQERSRLEKDAFSRHNGYELETLERDRVVYRLDISANSLNPYGMVHGGSLYTMADDAAGVAIHTDGRHYVTQTGTLHFLSNRSEGVIRAEGRVRRRGKQTAFASVEITDEQGVLLAAGDFVYFCIDPEYSQHT